MMQDFILFYLFMFWLMSILYKDNFLHNKLEAVSNTLKSSFIFELSQCKFCLDNWIGTFAAICLSIILWDWSILFWGILFASISAHFRK